MLTLLASLAFGQSLTGTVYLEEGETMEVPGPVFLVPRDAMVTTLEIFERCAQVEEAIEQYSFEMNRTNNLCRRDLSDAKHQIQMDTVHLATLTKDKVVLEQKVRRAKATRTAALVVAGLSAAVATVAVLD